MNWTKALLLQKEMAQSKRLIFLNQLANTKVESVVKRRKVFDQLNEHLFELIDHLHPKQAKDGHFEN